MELRRRPFPEAVRYALGLPSDCDDDDVLAELAVVRCGADRWREHVQKVDLAGEMSEFYGDDSPAVGGST